jgi:hypothetical protein
MHVFSFVKDVSLLMILVVVEEEGLVVRENVSSSCRMS